MSLVHMQRAHNTDELVRALVRMFSGNAAFGLVVGRTTLRDAVSLVLDCSKPEAEQVVEALVSRGNVIFVKAQALDARAFRSPGKC